MSAKPLGARTVLGDLRQAGSLRMLFPRPIDQGLQGISINTAGGITGGDRFELEARADAGTTLTLSTQAAERAYRSQPGEVGTVQTQLDVCEDARLNWLPQETILFQGCALRRSISVDLAPSAELLLCEPLVFGRAAMGETLSDGQFSDRIEVRRDGEAMFLDAMTQSGDIAAHLARLTTANGAGALATLIYINADAETHLTPLREAIGASGGVSLIKPDLLFARLLAPDSFVLRQILMPLLTRLARGPLPRPWMI
jgi:urease accessory protein